jgi:hypothetical protein
MLAKRSTKGCWLDEEEMLRDTGGEAELPEGISCMQQSATSITVSGFGDAAI